MGNGTSAVAAQQQSTARASRVSRVGTTGGHLQVRASQNHRRSVSNNKRDEADFHRTCRAVFDDADRNRNGVLDDGEFWLVLSSKKLNLNLSEAEVSEIRRLAEADGPLPAISYTQFVPMFKSLLQKVYEQQQSDWNDWCKLREPSTGNAYYLNKRTGQIQKTRPANFNEERVEEQSFEYITLDDGTELTTTLHDDGRRMYMDWETLKWRELPENWIATTVKTDFRRGHTQVAIDPNQSAATAANNVGIAEQDAEADVDPRVGEYWHPVRGLLHTYMFENNRNTRIYYDDRVNNWARMPLSWERNCKDVKAMLAELDAILPRWKNVNEQMLTIRECNYDLQDAIIFAEINWGYKPGVDGGEAANTEPQKLQRQVTRSGLLTNYDEPEEDLGPLSKAASDKLYNLQKRLTASEQRVQRLESELEEQATYKVKKLQRENTKIENDLGREQRRAEESIATVDGLQAKVRELNSRLGSTERELLAARAEADKMHALKEQWEAINKGDDLAQLVFQKGQELEQMRTENTHLKMKVQQLKTQIADPAKSPAAVAEFKKMYSQIRQIAAEKKALKRDMDDLIAHVGAQMEACIKQSKGLGDAIVAQVSEITVKYRSEVQRRKLLFNQLQELRGNIRVFLRARKDDRQSSALAFPTDIEVMVPDLRGDRVMWEFDRVFGVNSTQESIFEHVQPVIMSCIDGYNVCLMAYGQTGSGKTYTMTGPENNPGVNRRAIRELLRLSQEESTIKTTFEVTMIEVYNEQIYDLLSRKREPRKLKTGVHGVYVENAVRRAITTEAEVQQLLEDSEYNRTTAATLMNTDSSRSHLVLSIDVESLNTISNVTSTGRLTLVDLAGSERVSRSEATGERLVEAAAINKSLSALGQVFQSISQRAPHIPYRNSKLTHLLQESLGGDSKTCVFVNVSPTEDNLSETHSTLNFGKSIRQIELGPAKKHARGPKGLPKPPRPGHF